MRPMDRSQLFGDVIRALSLVLDLDEGVKLYHAWRVGVLARRIAQEVAPDRADRLYYAGLLHDIGGMGLRDHIIHHAIGKEPSPDAVRHVIEGVRIIQPFPPLAWIAPIVADHHERYDGRGYPHGRAGSEISVSAAVVHLADVLEVVLRSEAPGRRLQRTFRIVDEAAGTMCAPKVAEAARRLLEREPGLVDALYDPSQLDRLVGEVTYLPPELSDVDPVTLLSEMLWLFSRIIDAKHAYTSGHSQRVAHYALAISDALGSAAFNRWDLLWAGLLHDVGMVGVPRRILERPGALNEEETARVRLHAQDTSDIIRTISALAPLAYAAAAHHEWYDGSGYPRGLSGDDIPLIGRILAYADTYDGLTSDRAHRRRLSHSEAIRRIRQQVGTQLDPGLADAAFAALDATAARPPALPENVGELRAFFGLSSAGDPDRSGDRPAQRQVVRPVGRGVLLLDIEPWETARVDRAGRFLEGGEALAALLGISPTDRLESLLDEKSRGELAAMLGELSDRGASTRYLFSRSGRPLEVTLAREAPQGRGGEGAAGGEAFLLLYRAAENRLQSVQQLAVLYRNFISSSEAVCFTDPQGEVLDVNRTWLDLAHAQLRDVVGRPLGSLFTVPAPQPEWRPTSTLDRELAMWRGEVTLRTETGAAPPLEMRISPIRDVRGELVGYVAHGVDIRDRRLSEARMRRLNRLLSELGPDYRANVRRIVDVAVDTLHAKAGWYQRRGGGDGGTTGSEIQLVAVHGSPERLSSWRPGGVCLTAAMQQRAGGGAEVGVLPLSEAQRLGAVPGGLELPAMGDLVWHRVRAPEDLQGALVLVFDGERSLSGTEEALLGTLSAALATEEEKRVTTEALARSREALQEKNAALERLNLLKSDLLAVTSHDLKSPVNAMLSFVNLILDQLSELPEADMRRYLERISAAGNRLLRLIRDLLDVERLHAGLFELRPARALLDRLVGSVVELHEPVAEQRGVHLRLERRGACPALRLDVDQMERVVANLVSNALKVSEPGTTVTVVLDALGGEEVRILVMDQGPGVPESEREAIFDRYHQVAKPGRKGGSGLGLSIVQGIVELHGGRVWVENQADGGACFTVALPLRQMRAEDASPGDPRCGFIGPTDLHAALTPVFRAAGATLLRVEPGAAPEGPSASPGGRMEGFSLLLVHAASLVGPDRLPVRAMRESPDAPVLVEVRDPHVAPDDAAPSAGFDWVISPPVLDIEVRQILREARLRARHRSRARYSASGRFARPTPGGAA